MSLPRNFTKKVEYSGSCHLWKANKNKKGYGQYQEKGKSIRAHRFAWIYYNGEIPKGLFVLHKCDVPSCVNPEHLFLGTAKDNAIDMVRKGRHRCNVHPESTLRGESHGCAKLTQDEVDMIRKTYQRNTNGEFSQKGLAETLGVSYKQISKIINHKSWAI